ncbi:methyltransferase domain-containing protein [Candidatus Neomarinimicrobiota bacterium]
MTYEEWTSVEKIKRYKENRYKTIDQKLIDRREKSIVDNIFYNFKITGSILDIPCGYGRFHQILNAYGDVYAADKYQLIVQYQEEELGIVKSTKVCTADSIPYPDNFFNVVFCLRLMQHIHDSNERVKIYKELNRVSKEWVIVSLYTNTVLHSTIKRINRKKAKITFLQSAQVQKEFTESNLKPIYSKSVIPRIHGQKICLTKKIFN